MSNLRRVGWAAAGIAASLLFLLFYGCNREPTDPSELATHIRYTLTIEAGSSSANGTVTSTRGGISCVIVGTTGGADASGDCSRSYEAGTVVSVIATPAGGSVLKLDAEW